MMNGLLVPPVWYSKGHSAQILFIGFNKHATKLFPWCSNSQNT
uniref:Uncharacterized protein n=1 Tax=Anguilla anguilla TaxID=7936 RepID=A0A0E9QTV5_ANGAN